MWRITGSLVFIRLYMAGESLNLGIRALSPSSSNISVFVEYLLAISRKRGPVHLPHIRPKGEGKEP